MIPNEVYQEAEKQLALKILKNDIAKAHLEAYWAFDYNEAQNITRDMKEALKTALSASYSQITGEELFVELPKLSEELRKVMPF